MSEKNTKFYYKIYIYSILLKSNIVCLVITIYDELATLISIFLNPAGIHPAGGFKNSLELVILIAYYIWVQKQRREPKPEIKQVVTLF